MKTDEGPATIVDCPTTMVAGAGELIFVGCCCGGDGGLFTAGWDWAGGESWFCVPAGRLFTTGAAWVGLLEPPVPTVGLFISGAG